VNKKSFIPFLGLIAFLIIMGVVLFSVVNGISNNLKNDEITPELSDEFDRARWFIIDWYSELENNGRCQVFLNEIQLDNGKYSLTVANNRIRAVYPKGERFFKLDLVKQVEFFEINGVLRCRFSYGKNGEYMFRIN